MTWSTAQSSVRLRVSAWALARRQHGVVTRGQLLALGLTRRGIEHRIARGRLHIVARAIYAVGRPRSHAARHWMAAVAAYLVAENGERRSATPALPRCSRSASRKTARSRYRASHRTRSASAGVRVHRRPGLSNAWYGLYEGIPITTPVQTLIDLATRYGRRPMERAINEADKLGLVRTETSAAPSATTPASRGSRGCGRSSTGRTFRYTRTELERVFIPLARQAGLPSRAPLSTSTGTKSTSTSRPSTWWSRPMASPTTAPPPSRPRTRTRPRPHRRRPLPLRFTHGQIKYEPDRVVRVAGAPVGSP